MNGCSLACKKMLKKKKSGQAVQIRHQFEAEVVEVLQALLASSV